MENLDAVSKKQEKKQNKNGKKKKFIVLCGMIACLLIFCVVTVFVIMPCVFVGTGVFVFSAVRSGFSFVKFDGSETIKSSPASVQLTPTPTAKKTPNPTATKTPSPTTTKTPVATPTRKPSDAAIADTLAISLGYDSTGAVYNRVGDGPAIGNGWRSVETVVDSAIGRWTSLMTGNTYYTASLTDLYPYMEDAFTLETYVYFDEAPSLYYQGVVDNQEAGGFGFEVHSGYNASNVTVMFSIYLDYSYRELEVSVPLNRWSHLVATWDGTIVCLYLNGDLVSLYDSDFGLLFFPNNPTAQHLVIGASCSSNNGGGNGFNGRLSVCNLYLTALDGETVSDLYQQLN